MRMKQRWNQRQKQHPLRRKLKPSKRQSRCTNIRIIWKRIWPNMAAQPRTPAKARAAVRPVTAVVPERTPAKAKAAAPPTAPRNSKGVNERESERAEDAKTFHRSLFRSSFLPL